MSKLAAWFPLHKDTNDWSGNGMHLNKVGSGLVADDGVTGKCFKIATKNKADRLITQPFKIGGDHAMFCFLNVAELGNIGSANGVLGVHDHGRNTGTGITLKGYSATDFRVCVNTGHGNSRTFNTYGGATNLTQNKWNHVGFTWEQELRRLRLYVNGKIDYESVGVIPEMAFNASSPLAIFAWSVTYGSGQYAPAQKIQDVRIYEGIPSLNEIDRISKGCFLHWSFNEQAYGGLVSHYAGWEGYAPYLTVNETRDTYIKLTMKGNSTIALKPVGSNYVGKITRISGNVFRNGVPVHVTQVSSYEPSSRLVSDKATGWFCTEINNTTSGHIIHSGSGFGSPKTGDVYEFTNLRVEVLSTDNGHRGSVRDVTGFKNDGEATTDLPMYAKEESNLGAGCYYFDDDAIYSKEPITIGGSNMITMAAWIKSGKFGKDGYHQPINIGSDCAEMSIANDGALRVGFKINGARHVKNHGVNLLSYRWNHIAATYDGKTIKAYINGELVGSQSVSGQLDIVTKHVQIGQYSKPKAKYSSNQLYQSDVRVFGTALSDGDIEKLARQRLTVDRKGQVEAFELKESVGNTRVSSRGQAVAQQLLENNFKPTLIDYSSWVIGQSDAPNFGRNGSVSENLITTDLNPHGIRDVMWLAKKNDTTPDADGGYTTGYFNIDNKQAYRYSCWFNRKVMGNGTYYLGANGFAANGAVGIENMNGSANGNPYFVSTGAHKQDEWFLVIGYVYPAGTTTETYTDDGIYLANGNKIASSTTAFKWTAAAVKAKARAYLYYSSNADTRQYFYRPRVDVMDGTEPSLKDLIKCQEHTPLYPFYDANNRYKASKFGFGKTSIVSEQFKEI